MGNICNKPYEPSPPCEIQNNKPIAPIKTRLERNLELIDKYSANGRIVRLYMTNLLPFLTLIDVKTRALIEDMICNCEIDKILDIFDNSNDEQVKIVAIKAKMLIELIISINNGRNYK